MQQTFSSKLSEHQAKSLSQSDKPQRVLVHVYKSLQANRYKKKDIQGGKYRHLNPHRSSSLL